MYTSIKTVSAVVLSCCLLVTAPFAFAATDLFIRSTDVWHIPEQILAEDSVRIYIKVSNSGDEDATGLVRVIDTLQ
ncbi:MAG: hypothetical protein U9Q15_02540 [Patescibacteria group bacterium]|nr:hypothetical protein [Patescibacteria group bacterium]